MTDLLAGLRVLDFTLAAVGPFCSRILADLGAEVIHVEYPLPGWGYDAEGPESRFEAEGLRTTPANRLFLHTNGGKKSLAVNLKDPRGVQIIWDLIPQTDIVVENMTPRVMQRLGLSYVTLSDINPRLIMCSLTGFGQEGLEGDLGRPSSDPIAQAMSGMNWNTGDKDGPPYAVGGGIGDPITAVNGVVGILAAMLGLNATGKGQHIDISMVDANLFVDCTIAPAVAMFGSQAAAPYRNGQNQSYTFPMGTFKATGGYISIQAHGSGELSPWARLCELMGREDLVDDPEFRSDQARLQRTEEVVEIVEGWLCSLGSREEALALLAEERITAGPVLSQEEMLTHPWFVQRGTFGKVEYPGLGTVGVVEPPFKFSDAQAYVRGRAPEMGEHTREILSEYLGMDERAIEDLMSEKVLFESEAAVRVREGSTP